MKALFVIQFSEISGTSRIHVLQLLPYVKHAGISYDLTTMYPDSFFTTQMGLSQSTKIRKALNLLWYLTVSFFKKMLIVARARSYDVIFIQREVFPKFLYWMLRTRNPRIVYQIEDAIYEISPFLNTGFFSRRALRYQATLCKSMMRHAAVVIAENEELACEVRLHNAHVAVITCPIDVHRFTPKPPGTQTVTLGWVGSPASTYLLETLNPVFARLGKTYGDKIRLRVVGSAMTYQAPGIILEKRAWALSREAADVQSFDIGLMPLLDTPHNKGRLGGKMIQYMAVGIPVVADRVGLNPTIVREGENGFLVEGTDQWYDALVRLIEDATLRARMGTAGRTFVERTFSLEVTSRQFIDVLNFAWRSGTVQGHEAKTS